MIYNEDDMTKRKHQPNHQEEPADLDNFKRFFQSLNKLPQKIRTKGKTTRKWRTPI